MPYVVLGLGVLVGLFAFYRFMVKASVEEVRAFFRISVILIYALVVLGFALFGRIAVSIGLLLLCVPFTIRYYRAKMTAKKEMISTDIRDEHLPPEDNE